MCVRSGAVVCFAGAGVLLVAATAAAQFDRGQISGRIKDAQGGVVPGATVVVTNNQTQIQSTVVSDGTGFYTFPNLTAGKYTVSAELQGFKKALRENVTLDAAGLADARLHARDRRADRVGDRHG